MVEQFVDNQDRERSRVDWIGLRNEYFLPEGQSFGYKKNIHWSQIEDTLIETLKRLGIVSTSPINNFAIFRSGSWWGPYSSWIGHVFFTDIETAKEYMRVFTFKHGLTDSGEPELVRCVQA